MAALDNCIRSRDSTEIDIPPPKKLRIETESEARTKAPPGSVFYNGRVILKGQWNDPECKRQRDLFYNKFEESQGFDVDWDSFDYVFNVVNFDWNPYIGDKRSNDELMELLIQAAIEEHDEEHETKLESAKHVSANITGCKGLMYYITFWAIDVISSDREPKLYQAKVCKYREETTVVLVRLRPTQYLS